MPPKPNNFFSVLDSDRSQSAMRINGGRAVKDRGEPTDVLEFPRNMTLRNTNSMRSVAKNTNTQITFNGHFKFFFWGSAADVEQAKTYLEASILQDNPTYQRQEKDCGPPKDAEFEAMGSFVWPSQDYPPDKELGQRNFDVLNDIRKEYHCYIEYLAAKSAFIVKGSADDVPEAISRIKGVLCQTIAGQSQLKKLHLIQNTCGEVALKDYAFPVASRHGVLPGMRMTNIVHSIGASKDDGNLSSNAKQIKDNVLQTLSKVRWHRGHIEMRLHLGTLTTQQDKMFAGSTSLSDYEDIISDANFQATITEELGNKNLEDQLLRRFFAATKSLGPSDRFYQKLSDTKPEYMASIEVDAGDSSGNILMTRKWTEDDAGHLKGSNVDFRKLSVTSGRIRFLQVCMSDMLTNLTWQLHISAAGVQDEWKIPQLLKDHGEYYVLLDHEKARNLQSFCEFNKDQNGKPRPLTNKQWLKEKIVWKFDMLPPFDGYVVEVAKLFNTAYTPGPINGNEVPTVYEERWTVDVVHRQWDIQLSENHDLARGVGADWRADIQTWFPVESGDRDGKLKGHVTLLHALQRVQDIVQGKAQ